MGSQVGDGHVYFLRTEAGTNLKWVLSNKA